ncbi:MAG: class I SAM-dependent methyltransferase [Acidimicrobiales bacterium]
MITSTVTPTLLDHLALSPAERVLEVGCGTGGLSLEMAGCLAHGKVAGVDVSAGLVEIARPRSDEAEWTTCDSWLPTPSPTSSRAVPSAWPRVSSV